MIHHILTETIARQHEAELAHLTALHRSIHATPTAARRPHRAGRLTAVLRLRRRRVGLGAAGTVSVVT